MSEHDLLFTRLKLPTIVKGAGTLFVCGVIARTLGYAFHILAAKKVGLTAFGLYTLGLTLVRALAVDLVLGSRSSTVVRYVSIYHAMRDKARLKGTICFALINAAFLGALSTALIFFLSDFLAVRIFHQPQLSGVLTHLAFALPFVGLSAVLLLATVGVQIMTFQALTKDVFEPLVMLVVFLLLALQGFGLQALIYAYLSSAILGFIVAYYFFAKTFASLISSPFFPHPEAKAVTPLFEPKTIFKFALPLVITRIVTRLRRQGDILLLGLFVPASQVGLYAIVYKTVNALTEITDSLIGVFNPMIAASYEEGTLSTLKSQFQILSKWIFSLSFPIILFALFHAKAILSVLGNQFIGGEHSFIILVLGFLFEMISIPAGQLLTMSGKSIITLINTVGIGVLNLILFLIFIPQYGIEGASFAVALSMLLLGLARVIEGYKIIGAHPFTRKYLKPLLATCVALVITLWVDQALSLNKYLFLACSFATFLLAYLLTLVLIGLDPEDQFILGKVKERVLPSKRSRGAIA
ncbi:MAG: flippase [Deltaproteobacteria bacterium]|nr:flippase [Deltaproteobacteria bacterium]